MKAAQANRDALGAKDARHVEGAGKLVRLHSDQRNHAAFAAKASGNLVRLDPRIRFVHG